MVKLHKYAEQPQGHQAGRSPESCQLPSGGLLCDSRACGPCQPAFAACLKACASGCMPSTPLTGPLLHRPRDPIHGSPKLNEQDITVPALRACSQLYVFKCLRAFSIGLILLWLLHKTEQQLNYRQACSPACLTACASGFMHSSPLKVHLQYPLHAPENQCPFRFH